MAKAVSPKVSHKDPSNANEEIGQFTVFSDYTLHTISCNRWGFPVSCLALNFTQVGKKSANQVFFVGVFFILVW